MVNICLAYGVPLNYEELQEVLEKLVDSGRSEFAEYIGDEEVVWHNDNSNNDMWTLFELFDIIVTSTYQHLGEDSLIILNQNGTCCSVDKEFPYFLGWKSKGECASSTGSTPITLLADYQREELDQIIYGLISYINSDKEIRYYIMAHNCDYCT